MVTQDEYLTPPQLAKVLHTSADKVRALIAAGALVAINVANNVNGERPRWRIRQRDLEVFLASRSSRPAPKPRRRRRASSTAGKEFF